MAATAMAAVVPSLCTPITTITTNHLKSNSLLLKLNNTKTLLHSPLSVFPQRRFHHKWRVPRISAAVAEEEPAETASEEVQVEGEEGESDEICTKLYIGNLPYHCDSAQLAGIVQPYGNPELVEVLYHRETGRSRGFAFVTMSSVEDCNAVIENLDGSEYGGRYLRVNFADKPRQREPLFPETEHKLFIGNLSWSVTSESLYEAFQGYGNVVGARVLHDGETGKSRGYGFVCYATRSEMENALAALNGMELEGRSIRVSLAEGKKL
ncbi:hypothetical protein RND81_05G154800 [Saponaria officinalis]|uniref:RRM domain-containing protein n=1 Tax=Saponaria officinalis TaxID=3572 RepID=A0AAW1KYE2_SAPOF